jgi:predicted Fe-Mo cluster-binding NifX family protein
MKVAVASADGTAVSQHFGQSRCFIVFDVTDGKITGREVRDNTFTPHARGQCHGHGHGHGAEHVHGHGHEGVRGHQAAARALADCQALLCRGMGGRAAADLEAGGIRPVVFVDDLSPEEAVAGLVAGTLKVASTFCRCHG